MADTTTTITDPPPPPPIFGWCNDGFHEGRVLRYGTNCPGHVATGRRCSCWCHERKAR